MFKGNKIYKVNKDGKKKRIFGFKGLKIRFKGENSTVILHEPLSKIKKSKIIYGNGCFVEIGASNNRIARLLIFCQGDNNSCKIGNNFSCTDTCNIMLQKESNLSVNIGDNCMFASNIRLRTTDAHAIYDVETKEIQNYGKNINIGEHVWLALGATVLKGVTIADNCVIGTNSTVTKDCLTPNSIYAGFPAKLIRSGSNWRREAPKR